MFPAGPSTLWAWLGSDGEPELERLREAIVLTGPNVRVAVGPTAAGVTGFRRSHAAASSIQALLAGNPAGERLALYRELEVVALAAQDRDRAADFVAATLGPLAADDAGASRLREEPLRVFLDEADKRPYGGATTCTATRCSSASPARPSCSGTARASAGSSSRSRSSSPATWARAFWRAKSPAVRDVLRLARVPREERRRRRGSKRRAPFAYRRSGTVKLVIGIVRPEKANDVLKRSIAPRCADSH